MKKKESFAKRYPKLAKAITYGSIALGTALASNADRIYDYLNKGGDSNPSIEVGVDTTKATEAHTKEIYDTSNAQKVAEMVRIVKDKKVHCNFQTHDGWNYNISSYENGIMITLDKDGDDSQYCHFTIDSTGTLTDFYGKIDGEEVSVHGKRKYYSLGDRFYDVDENPKLKKAWEQKRKQCAAAFQYYYTILKAKEARLPEVNEENKKMCATIMNIVRKHCDKKGYVVFTDKGHKYSLRVPDDKKLLSVWKRPVGTTSQETCDSWSYNPNGNIQFVGFNQGKDLVLYEPDYIVDDWKCIGKDNEKRALTETEKNTAESTKEKFQKELSGIFEVLQRKYPQG